MRILIGSESFYPNVSGVAVTARNLASYLAERGHQVAVLAPSVRPANGHEIYPEGFSVYRFSSIRNPFRKGFRVTMHPYKKILGIVRAWKPDVIHLQDPASICSCLAKAARQCGVPVVISHHFTLDYIMSYLNLLKPLQNYSNAQLTRYFKDFYNRCQYVVCPSELVKDWLVSVGVTTPVTVVSNGVNLERFYSYEAPNSTRTSLGLPNLPIILYVGRIDREKSLDTLVKAAPTILNKRPAHFVFCGGGSLLERLKKQTARSGLADYITFCGQLDHQDETLPRIYQLADCFVMPSCCETQSIVTLEAMAAGLPIVAAAAGALPELVANGENGYLFRPGDHHDLARKVGLILDNPALAQQMGMRSFERVLKHDINLNMRQIEHIYEGLAMYATA
ncbi:MAG: glycosyltransferase [Syntrophomonadaceae bacterium]